MTIHQKIKIEMRNSKKVYFPSERGVIRSADNGNS
nr:MAG TPA: hypothetical protein [Caudoviricetes sp.]